MLCICTSSYPFCVRDSCIFSCSPSWMQSFLASKRYFFLGDSNATKRFVACFVHASQQPYFFPWYNTSRFIWHYCTRQCFGGRVSYGRHYPAIQRASYPATASKHVVRHCWNGGEQLFLSGGSPPNKRVLLHSKETPSLPSSMPSLVHDNIIEI